MAILNFTPHEIKIYSKDSFVNLKQVNETTWVADDILGFADKVFPSNGIARIKTDTSFYFEKDGVTFAKTVYGDLQGIPDSVSSEDIIIVSLPAKSNAHASNHPRKNQLVSPYIVVRDAKETSKILGCCELSF